MTRQKLPQHFTASAITIFQKHILLIHHPRIQAWLPPGGHIEDFELPHETAVRETLEETGVKVEVVYPELPPGTDSEAFFMPSPLCLHNVRACEKGQDLYHLDLAYLCRPLINWDTAGLPELSCSSEIKEAAWVNLGELDKWVLAKNVRQAVDLALKRV